MKANAFGHSYNMPTSAKKLRDSSPQVKARLSHGPGSINDEQMNAFQEFLESWIIANCTDRGGERWSQRRIATELGITQNEVGRWQSGKARPGLPRLVHLRKRTGICIECMLGLPSPHSCLRRVRAV